MQQIQFTRLGRCIDFVASKKKKKREGDSARARVGGRTHTWAPVRLGWGWDPPDVTNCLTCLLSRSVGWPDWHKICRACLYSPAVGPGLVYCKNFERKLLWHVRFYLTIFFFPIKGYLGLKDSSRNLLLNCVFCLCLLLHTSIQRLI